MKKIVWIGPRESDTYYSNIDFYASIVYNGEYYDNCIALTNKLNSRINQYKNTHLKLTDYIKDEAQKFMTDESVSFMFYNPMQSYILGEEYVKKAICMNPLPSIDFIRNKGKMRSYARSYIDTVPFVQFTGNQIPEVTFKGFDNRSFVLQKVISSGGYGTYRLTLDAVKTFLLRNPANETYILSPYIANAVPINVHVVIFDNDSIIFPPSLQILEECERHFVYIGADFHTNFSEDAYKKIIHDASILANELRSIGYRGVCGFDFMLTRDKLLFLEVNTRFQASTFMLNRILQEEKMPSIHELNIMAFEHEPCPLKSFSSVRSPKSFFTVMGRTIPSWYSDLDSELPSVISQSLRDGFRSSMSTEEDAYLCRAVTDRNLGWVNRDNQLVLAPNIRPDSNEWKHKILSGDLLALKISLLNQGVRISASARQQMEVTGHIRPGVFQSVDLRLPNNMVINAPFHTDFSELSPYCIEYDGKTYILTYERQFLSKISFDTVDVNGDKIASNGTIYRHASLLATDRLRVH
ncbi:MAG: ATP-grasp domain-containing protein, partial [Lachnospiraceae bacterium]|nr:ATP-grasp domain-containing protein [Lachnospiraceae bacterium]